MSRAPARVARAPPHPGAFIREEILDELGLSVSEAAKVLDVRRATLSDLINGNAALSAEMALSRCSLPAAASISLLIRGFSAICRTNPEPDSEVTVKAFLSGDKNNYGDNY